MVRLTILKARRMTLGLRQLDVVRATGIGPSRYSAIENELITPRPEELALFEGFFAAVEAKPEVLEDEEGHT